MLDNTSVTFDFSNSLCLCLSTAVATKSQSDLERIPDRQPALKARGATAPIPCVQFKGHYGTPKLLWRPVLAQTAACLREKGKNGESLRTTSPSMQQLVGKTKQCTSRHGHQVTLSVVIQCRRHQTAGWDWRLFYHQMCHDVTLTSWISKTSLSAQLCLLTEAETSKKRIKAVGLCNYDVDIFSSSLLLVYRTGITHLYIVRVIIVIWYFWDVMCRCDSQQGFLRMFYKFATFFKKTIHSM